MKFNVKNVKIVEVPGVFEIPLICKKLAKSKKYDAILTLGAVIKGQTDHYEMLCRAMVDGVRQVMLDFEIPIVFEVLMVRDILHAKARASLKNWHENKGYIGVRTIFEMMETMKRC
ncbi:6,7-dimethyl-8-ribityllumazine synthase [Candidatus Peregrinibacteria bacterium RIFOXYA12_FULL_33_12]|nr:MAG: 6,7-dimethyl-8-ribityllumazine synthase [Candidatus Peregrinibacteria bacterium RIFOXYA12_FULL_33_12]